MSPAPTPAPRARRFRSLASRMTGVALLQLLLLVTTALVIGLVERPLRDARPEEQLDRSKLEALAADDDALHVELARLREERISVSIYNAEGQLVTTNVDPPLALPPRPRMHGPEHGPHDHPPRRRDEPGLARPEPPGEPGPRMSPPDGGGRTAMTGRGDRPMVMPFHGYGDRGVLVARGERAQPPGWIGPVLVLVSSLLILVLGAIANARWIVRPIERLSRTARALGTGDLQARSRLERTDEIGELGYRLDEMADRLEHLMRSEKELFANVAHELRTPLARIGVALDLAAEGDGEAARASLDEIAVDVGELETIVDDILTTMRFEIAQGTPATAILPMRRAQVTPGSIADAAVERCRSRHPARPLALSVAGDAPPIDADPMLLRRVLDNLLDNAHKYTPDLDAPIEITVERDGAHVVFEVRDRGAGISADELPRVFTPFYRAERSRSRETGGVGLGLTLAKRIVVAHGGTIVVQSQVGVGTSVRVSLPAA